MKKHEAPGFPVFKRKGRSSDSFRYPQGFKLDERNSRVFLPKIGWVSKTSRFEIDFDRWNVIAGASAANEVCDPGNSAS